MLSTPSTRRAERRVEVVLEEAAAHRGVVGDVRLLGAAGAVGVDGVDRQRVARAGARREGDRPGVPRDGRAPDVRSAAQPAAREIDGGVGPAERHVPRRRERRRRDVQAGAAGEDVEVLRAVGPRGRRAAHVDDRGEARHGPLHALVPVPLADHAVRGDLVEVPVLVVVLGLVADRTRADRVVVPEVLEEGRAAVEDAVGVGELVGAVEVLAHEPARVDVVALERHLREGERVVLPRGREREAPGRAAAEAEVVEHRRRVALRHHAALLDEDGLHLLREEHERRDRATRA